MVFHSKPDQNQAISTSNDNSEISEIIENSTMEEIQVTETQGTSSKEVNDPEIQKNKETPKSIGGGLYEITKNGIVVGYRFKKMFNGDTIDIPLGKMTELRARKESERLNKKFSDLQLTKKTEQALSRMADKKIKEEAMPCFRSYEDAKLFAHALRNKLVASSEEFKIGNSDGLDLEIYTILWTMLTTPLGVEDLLRATQKDVFFPESLNNNANFWLGSEQPNVLPFCVFLTNATALAILDLNQRREPNLNKLIFEQMNNLSKESRGIQITSKINAIWTRYEINPKKFTPFFQYTANRYSSFKTEFIASFIKKQNGDPQWLRYNDERKAIMAWWVLRLKHGDFCFNQYHDW